jgi:glc operon protein GlcG
MQTIEYGPHISLDDAKKVVAAAEASAEQNGWPMVIAVVDSSGHLVLLHRMNNAQYGSIAIAEHKAVTAVNFKRPTKVFEDAIAAGGINIRLLSTPGFCALEGGVPLIRDGRLIGAIGVSGAKSTEDAIVAAAGVDALAG